MRASLHPTRKKEPGVGKRRCIDPLSDRLSRLLSDRELHRSLSLSLHNHRALGYMVAMCCVDDPKTDEVASPERPLLDQKSCNPIVNRHWQVTIEATSTCHGSSRLAMRFILPVHRISEDCHGEAAT